MPLLGGGRCCVRGNSCSVRIKLRAYSCYNKKDHFSDYVCQTILPKGAQTMIT